MRLTYADGDNIPLAVGAIVFTVLALSLGDAVIKLISTDFVLWQIFIIRSLIAGPVVLAMILAKPQRIAVWPQRPAWLAVRSLMLAAMWVAYYAALPHVELSVAATVYYTLPLFIVLFAAVFAGEAVGATGWLAVFLGFLGVVAILKPQTEDFNAYALLPLASAILYACAMLLTRTKCRNEHPLVLSLALNVAFIVLGGAVTLLLWLWPPAGSAVEANRFVFGTWAVMGRTEWLAMALLALFTLIGSIGAAIAYQAGPSSTVATFDFAYLAFAALWGLLFFGEIPDAVSALGIALITLAGYITVRRN